MTTATEFQAKVTKTETNMDRLDQIVNGGPTTDVQVDTGTVPSFAKLQTAAAVQVSGAQAARVSAETARDQSISAAAASRPATDDDQSALPLRFRGLDINSEGGWTWNADDTITGVGPTYRLGRRYVQLDRLSIDTLRAGRGVAFIRVRSGDFNNAPTIQQITAGNVLIDGTSQTMARVGNTWRASIATGGDTATGFVVDFYPPASGTVTIEPPSFAADVPAAASRDTLLNLAHGRIADELDQAPNLFGGITSANSEAGLPPTLNADGSVVTVKASSQVRMTLPVGSAFPDSTGTFSLLFRAAAPGNAFMSAAAYSMSSAGAGISYPATSLGIDDMWIVRLPAAAASGSVATSLVLLVNTNNVPSGMVAADRVFSDFVICRGNVLPTRRRLARLVSDALISGDAAVLVTATNKLEADRRAIERKINSPAFMGLLEQIVREPVAEFVATFGSDTAGAGTYVSPHKTIDKAFSVTTLQDRVGLRNAQLHAIGTRRDFEPQTNSTRSFAGVGPETYRAVIDARQAVSALSWTSAGGGVFTATANHREAVTAVGRATIGNNFCVWYNPNGAADLADPEGDGGVLPWVTDNGSWTANINALKALPSGFTVRKSGSGLQDPRDEPAIGGSIPPSMAPATAFDYAVKLPGGISPATGGVYIADLQQLYFFAGDHRNVLAGLTIGKDGWNTGPNSFPGPGAGPNGNDAGQPDGVPTWTNCQARDFPVHGWSGPAVHVGHCFATGRGVPGDGADGSKSGRARGYGFNYFNNEYEAKPRRNGHLYARNVASVIYGHGVDGASDGWRELAYDGAHYRNTGLIMAFPTRGGTTQLPFVETVSLDWFGPWGGVGTCDQGFTIPGIARLGTAASRSAISLSATPQDNPGIQHALELIGHMPNVTLTNTDITFRRNPMGGLVNALVYRASDATHSAPVVVLDGVRDLSPQGRTGTLYGGTATSARMSIELKGGTRLGDLVVVSEDPSPYVPVSLTVRSGCRFGFANMRAAAMGAYFAAHGGTLTIEPGVEIVNSRGVVIEITA